MVVMRQKILDYAKKSATNAFITASKRVIQEATGDLIVNKTDNKITELPTNPQQNNSETITI